MFAIHATSLSWQDFRLACALLDLQIPGRNMRQSALDQFQQTTSKVTEESMRIACRDVAQRVDSVPSIIPGQSDVTSALMPHGTVEAITATRASVRLLTPSLGRFWITISFNEYVGSV